VLPVAGALFGTLWDLFRDRPWLLPVLATSIGRRGVPRWLLMGAVAAAAAALAARLARAATATPKTVARPPA
jgi:hypothetical protein